MFRKIFFAILAVILVVFLFSFIFWQDQITNKISEYKNWVVERIDDATNKEGSVGDQDLENNNQDSSDNNEEVTSEVSTSDIEEPRTTVDENNIEVKNSDRIMLTVDNVDDINKELGCNLTFNTELANEFIRFEQYNLGFDIPYNKKWGNDDYQLAPYFQKNKNIDFGSMDKFEACSWVRKYSLTIKDFANVEQIKNQAKELGVSANNIEEKIINSNPAVFYTQDGFCNSVTVEIVGSSYNYSFSTICTSDINKAKQELENIVKSVLVLDKMLG